MAERRTTYLQMSLEHEEKDYIKNKATELGYKIFWFLFFAFQ
ncbi:hypothetical protein ACUN90_22145 [Escherichia sp. SP-MK2]